MSMNSVVESVTARIVERSKVSRRRYLALMERNRAKGVMRPKLACGNIAHAIAASSPDKPDLMRPTGTNLGIITTYNDMLSAHQPYGVTLSRLSCSHVKLAQRRRSQAVRRRCATA